MAERIYTISAQLPTRIITETNRVVDGIELHVNGPGEISFTLEVPAHSTPERIDQLIRERLNKHILISQLGGE